MKLKKPILFIIIVVLINIYTANVFAINHTNTGDYVNKSGKAIMIYESMSGTPTNTYLLNQQKFTVDWIEYEYYGTQIIAISLPNKKGGFLFIDSMAPELFHSLLSSMD